MFTKIVYVRILRVSTFSFPITLFKIFVVLPLATTVPKERKAPTLPLASATTATSTGKTCNYLLFTTAPKHNHHPSTMTPTAKAKNTEESAVLYYTSLQNVKNNNNPSPLEFTYHSPSTRRLSSLLPTSTTPEPSTITEIDSAYCPQSLVSWDANRAFHISSFPSSSSNNLYEDNRNDYDDVQSMGEVSCPICESVLMLTIQESKLFPSLENRDEEASNDDSNDKCTHLCMYKCGYCQWNSYDELKIYSKININHMIMEEDTKDEGETILSEKEKVEKATKNVQIQLYKTMMKSKQSTLPFMNAVINRWNEQFKLEEMNKRKTEMLISKPTPTTTSYSSMIGNDDFGNNRGGSTGGGTIGGIANTCSILNTKDLNSKTTSRGGALWTLEELDAFIIQKKNDMNDQVKESIFFQNKDPNTQIATSTLSHLSIKDLSSTGSNISNKTHQTFRPSNQCTISTTNTKEEQVLMPTPVKLRTRAIKRDYRESSLGKPGILVKPKVNPLEGDSSYRRHGQGQWWKKVSRIEEKNRLIVITFFSFGRC